VSNTASGVFVEVEGEEDCVRRFLDCLAREKPPLAIIVSLETRLLDPVGYDSFEIRASDDGGEKSALVLPDVATCAECLREIFDPDDRRYLYPFTNCTNCGPRFSIIESLPYDRRRTTMKKFDMCKACRREYENPSDRRFHAQPNACPDCGPKLALLDGEGRRLSGRHEALLAAAEAIREERIVAVKGLGGFHLVVNARSEPAVRRLRDRKGREEKPFALMTPTLDDARRISLVGDEEAHLLRSPESPILLLRRQAVEKAAAAAGPDAGIAPAVAPENPFLGVMLPNTPLHHILLADLGFPVVATSGNLSNEPICTDESEALRRLAGIADFFLAHDRPIHRHVDDSIVRVIRRREMVMRRARGYAPLPVRLADSVPESIAVGGHLKNAVAVGRGRDVFIGPHIGDLETRESFDAFRRSVESLAALHEIRPRFVACDLHPEYLSTRHGESLGPPIVRVQHHHAHLLACMAENELSDPVLGVAWDGTGYGTDGTVWGGEFLLPEGPSFRRIAWIRPFPLPGGEAAIREPRRSALGLLHEILGDELARCDDLPPLRAFRPEERRTILGMLAGGVRSPMTTSAGRLFDAVSSLAGIRQTMTFEGQAAMELEFALPPSGGAEAFPLALGDGPEGATIIDWEPMVRAILEAIAESMGRGEIALRFHNTLAAGIVNVAKRVGVERVALTGGCFQNEYLLMETWRRLDKAGFRPYTHQRVPPNDGGIALGQIAALARGMREDSTDHVPRHPRAD